VNQLAIRVQQWDRRYWFQNHLARVVERAVRALERVPTAAARVGLLVRAPERVPTAAARV